MSGKCSPGEDKEKEGNNTKADSEENAGKLEKSVEAHEGQSAEDGDPGPSDGLGQADKPAKE